ncbi:c-type cytochrome [Flavobacterium sp.]|uniref:c-type cytochrome n=1 Tax=Flavobacterium sp. TaxID=239 RepID=UPI003752DE83
MKIFFLVFILSLSFYFQKESRKYLVIQDVKYKNGKKLFEKNCLSCHSIDMKKKATAPALGGITKKREKKWLYDYTKDSYGMFEKEDKIAVEIKNQNWGLMPSFIELTDKDLDAIYYFIENK